MATYYVDITSGNDADDGLSEANAWQTFAKTQSAPIAAGDKVYVKGSATYTTRLVISIVGTAAAPIVFEGYTTTLGDGGMVTVTDTTNNTGLTPAAGSNFYIIKNFRFTGMSGVGAGNATADFFTYKKCRFDNNGGDGVAADQNALFEGCYAHDNGGDGFDVGGATAFICCISNANTLDGFKQEGGTCYKCLAFSNGGNGFTTTLATYHVLIDCVVDGDAKDSTGGYDIANAYANSQVVVVNCVAYDCITGFTSNADLSTERSISRNNLVNANTTNYTSFQTFTGEVTAAPGFVNEAAQDYTPDTGSPLIEAGFGPGTNGWITQTGDAPDIGAVDDVGGGSCDYPAVGDVELGVVYASGVSTGTFAKPAVGEVKTGIGYGAGGTEFTGTRTHPTVAQVLSGIQYGAGGTEFTGTLTAGGGGGAPTLRTGGQL